MTAKAKSIGTTTFTYQLWVEEFENPSNVSGEMVMSAAGSHITYAREIATPYITLVSKEHGWLHDDDIATLKTQYASIGSTFTLTYSDDTTETVRFAHEKGMSFVPLYEGACYYRVTINLAKA